jgi:aldehyde:ferredoxin oxidoreductase
MGFRVAHAARMGPGQNEKKQKVGCPKCEVQCSRLTVAGGVRGYNWPEGLFGDSFSKLGLGTQTAELQAAIWRISGLKQPVPETK